MFAQDLQKHLLSVPDVKHSKTFSFFTCSVSFLCGFSTVPVSVTQQLGRESYLMWRYQNFTVIERYLKTIWEVNSSTTFQYPIWSFFYISQFCLNLVDSHTGRHLQNPITVKQFPQTSLQNPHTTDQMRSEVRSNSHVELKPSPPPVVILRSLSRAVWP